MTETIFAMSTVLGKSGVAVIRISGPNADKIPALLGYYGKLEHRKASYARLYHMHDKSILDDVILLFFKGPHSFNGEDILEIHLHGSLAIIAAALEELNTIGFIRPAEAGEFTKIAFKNGKMDLVNAEALADLLDAETEMQKKIAQKQLSGELSQIYCKWRDTIISVLSQLEALIDFPEDDIPQEALYHAENNISKLIFEIQTHLKNYQSGRCIMDGINVVISGAPNTGKSSLINVLAKKEIAIVSDIPGTTRDILQTKLNLDGFVVLVSDTAGIRDATDIIEKEGVKRARNAVKEANINVIIISQPVEILEHIKGNEIKTESIWLLNKVDLMQQDEVCALISQAKQYLLDVQRTDTIIPVSVKLYVGIEEFIAKLTSVIKDKYQDAVLSPVTTRLRQRKGLQECLLHLRSFHIKKKLEIAVQDIRNASNNIGALTGKICIEEVLDEIFANFCIGK